MCIKTAAIAALLASAGLAVAGCGGGNTTLAGSIPPAMTFTVTAGGSMANEAVQTFQFYPQTITVDAGDTVSWTFPSGEPHTVTLLGPVTTPPAPSTPQGQAPAGGNTYDGSAYVSSGFALLGKTYSLTFPKPGTYAFICLLHNGMKGTIVVQPAGTAYPQSQASYTTAALTQQTADLNAGMVSVSAFPYAAGGAHVVAGISPGLASGAPGPSSVLRFLDGPSLDATAVNIAAGQTVTWTNQSNNAPHTVTIAPVGVPFPNLPPFTPPSGGTVYDGTSLVNSGVLQPGASFSVTFPKAGTYEYHCIFHDDTEHMIGTVVVH